MNEDPKTELLKNPFNVEYSQKEQYYDIQSCLVAFELSFREHRNTTNVLWMLNYIHRLLWIQEV